MAICGILTSMQLGLLGKANFKAAKSLTTLEQLQQTGGIAKDSTRMFVVFLGNTLEENKVLFLLKVPQCFVFNRLMNAASQSFGCDQKSPNLELKTQFWN